VPAHEAEPGHHARTARQERLAQLVASHVPTVWRFLRRLGLGEPDADDAVQEVVLVVARKLADIQPLAERKFLLRTAYRVGCRIRSRRMGSVEAELPDPLPHADLLVDQRRARELLDAILATMTVELRTVFVLHEIEGLTMAEVAETLELSPGTVASRLRRARQQFDRQVARAQSRRNEGKGEP
jgi:RNA polymerase sigma-70 factor (ECF subfamily)